MTDGEDVLDLPAELRRLLHPRRGGSPGDPIEIDKTAAAWLREQVHEAFPSADSVPDRLLDVLAAIGTDLAPMELHGISERVRFKGLRARDHFLFTFAELSEVTASDVLADLTALVPEISR
ncbi:hypothetical protein GCM10010191_83680 [Actinomadura vinacea]|uniref:Uncharacterized protein n=1 Tax=Actinomadura vinacea TaxID=115336 RepID=A0ABN3KC13_9ACTN